MDIDGEERAGLSAQCTSFLRHFFVFWIVQGVACGVVQVLALERGREARHIRK